MAHGHTRMFVKQLFANFRDTGAIAPSSDELAQRIVDFAGFDSGAVVAEYGPGTGVFTKRILERLAPRQCFFAVEINEDFAKTLRHRFPGLHLHVGSAENVKEYCAAEGVDHVDCVVSGLPWANFPDELQEAILGSMLEVLPKGGVFVTFAYLQGLVMPAGRTFKSKLKKKFSKVENSGVVWKNIPPAIIYRCRK